MTYEQVQSLKPEAFKRFCGVGSTTFAEMVSVLEQQQLQKRKPGRPPKLSLEDQVLLALQYWREYRTYFHIAQSWNINESTAFRIVRHVEDTLIRSGRFSLPGKKALLQPDSVLKVVVVDVTESPVERPKKNNDKCFPVKKSIIP
jgi:hypothetical protein